MQHQGDAGEASPVCRRCRQGPSFHDKTGPWMHPSTTRKEIADFLKQKEIQAAVHRALRAQDAGPGPSKQGPTPSPPVSSKTSRALRDLPLPSPPPPHPQSRDTGKTPPPPQSQIRAQAPRKVNMAVTMTRSSLTRFWRTLYKSSSASTPERLTKTKDSSQVLRKPAS